jgi:4-carboxymuconolactone decarboxylase
VDLHSARSLRAGHSEDKLAAILDYAGRPEFTEAERAALAYTEGMTKTPVDVPDAVFDALKAHYNTPAIVEISVFAAYQNFNAKFNGALRTEINEFCPVDLPGLK